MSSAIYFIIGVLFGALVVYIGYLCVLCDKNDIIKDYKKGIDIHNKRELRLIFINQSIKDYVKKQLDILKNKENFKNKEEESLTAATYIVYKDIERVINKLEKNSEDLKV